MSLNKGQRQRLAYNKMVENHENYKKELAKIVDKKGNPDPRLMSKYIYLMKKIDNTDPTLKYKNTEKQNLLAKKLNAQKKQKEEQIRKLQEEKEYEKNRVEILSDSDSD